MAVTEEALRHVGIRATPDQLERMVLAALGEMNPVLTTEEPSREWPPMELAALARGGFSFEPVQGQIADDPIASTVALQTALVATSVSVIEAAHSLGLNPSRIRQRLAARTLYGLKTIGGWRLPAFQFDQGRPLPGIERILPYLDRSLHPVAVYSWFTAPDPDLEVSDVPVSPRDWLRLGNDPDAVARLATAL